MFQSGLEFEFELVSQSGLEFEFVLVFQSGLVSV